MEGVPPAEVRPDRWKLGFKDAALSAFSFLEEVGFRVARADVTFVRYESPRVFVNVYHGRASYELGVEIGERGKDRGFHIGTVARFVTGCHDRGFGGGTADTRPLVKQFVQRLAERTRAYAVPFLRDDSRMFADLRAYVARENAAVLKRWDLERARAAADKARMAGDWPGVVRAYEPIADDLMPMERRRLEYARKQLHRAH